MFPANESEVIDLLQVRVIKEEFRRDECPEDFRRSTGWL